MADIVFVGQFIVSKTGKTGLTVTVDVDRYTISDGSRTALVTAGSATEGRRGLYHYRLASADLSLYQYVATFITADATVDQQEIAAIGLVVPDALVSSRAAAGEAPTEAEIIAAMDADPPAVNVTYSAGVALGGRLAEVLDLPQPAPTVEDIRNEIDTNSAQMAAILADTNAIKMITDQLDVSSVTQVAASSAGHLTITAGRTFSEAITGLIIPATWVTAIWTLKRAANEADASALVQLRETNPSVPADGLQRLNGSASLPAGVTAASGDLTVNQAGGSITVKLNDELSVLLGRSEGLGWDVKFIDASGDSSGTRGTADVDLTETKAVV